jgi:ankyrin repeat protein
MQLRKKGTTEILEARYKTWSKSEFEKDGESELLNMSTQDALQRAGDPVLIIQSVPPKLVYPKDAHEYILIKTTQTGQKNLVFDQFNFGDEKDNSPGISDWFDKIINQGKEDINLPTLFEAVRLNQEIHVRNILEHKSNPDKSGENNFTPLMISVMLGHIHLAKQLIAAGADINLQNVNGDTALILASRKMDSMIISILLADEKDLDGKRTTLIWDVWHGFSDFYDPFKNSSKPQALIPPSAFDEKPELVELLLESGANVNVQNADQETALMTAARSGYVKIMKLLLDAGAKTDLKDKEERTAIFTAASYFKPEGFKMLLECSDLSIKNKSGYSLLFELVWNGSIESMKALLEIYDDKMDICKAMNLAVHTDNIELVKLLLTKKPDINYQHEKTGDSPVMFAVKRSNAAMLSLLLEQHPSLGLKNKDGNTVFDIARKENNSAIIHMLEKASNRY